MALGQKILENFSIANINIPNHYPEQDSDLEYLCWQWKNSPVSSDLKPRLAAKGFIEFQNETFYATNFTFIHLLQFQCSRFRFINYL